MHRHYRDNLGYRLPSLKELTNMASEPTDQERWQEWAIENNICAICSNDRAICGGEETHG